MSSENLLKGKSILVVDDEPDVLDIVAEELDMCTVDKAMDYDTAIQYLTGYTYDIVILDIMGVNGFELLQDSVSRGYPTVMFTALMVGFTFLVYSRTRTSWGMPMRRTCSVPAGSRAWYT